MNILDPLLNVREAAALLEISIPTWHRWVSKGILPPAVKLGGFSWWPKSEILAFVEQAKAARTVTK